MVSGGEVAAPLEEAGTHREEEGIAEAIGGADEASLLIEGGKARVTHGLFNIPYRHCMIGSDGGTACVQAR